MSFRILYTYIPAFVLGMALLASCRQSDNTGKHFSLAEEASDTVSLFARGLISTSLNERDLAIYPDRSELCYTLATLDNARRAIIRMVLDGDKVRSREVISFSGVYDDIEPFYSPDGSRLFFSSDRPTSPMDMHNDYNIWFSEREGAGWGEPVPLDSTVNSELDEFYPSVAANGNLYFTAAYEDAFGREDIFVAEFEDDHYHSPLRLDSNINSIYYEFNAWISPDERLLFFSSFGRPDEYGGGDLYVSRRLESGKWSPARNLGPDVNSEKLDYCPFFDPETGTLYFSSNRRKKISDEINYQILKEDAEGLRNGMNNIYHVRLADSLLQP